MKLFRCLVTSESLLWPRWYHLTSFVVRTNIKISKRIFHETEIFNTINKVSLIRSEANETILTPYHQRVTIVAPLVTLN